MKLIYIYIYIGNSAVQILNPHLLFNIINIFRRHVLNSYGFGGFFLLLVLILLCSNYFYFPVFSVSSV